MFIPDIEIQADNSQAQSRINEAVALVPDLSFAGISFEASVAIKKEKIRQDIAKLQAQLDLLEETF